MSITSGADKALQMLKDELKSLDQDRAKLVKAIEALGAKAKAPVSSNGSKPAARKPGKRRGPSQTDQLIKVIGKHPEGITVAEAAKEIPGANKNSLYATAAQLAKNGRLKKSGPKYKPVAAKKVPAKKKAAAKK